MPRAERAASRRRSRTAAALLCLLTLAPLADACTEREGGAPEARAAGKGVTATAAPAVSQAEARQVLSHYVKVNNQANGARDTTLLGTVEDGAVYERDKAGFQQYVTMAKEARKALAKPFRYTEVHFQLPARAPWFAAVARIDRTERHDLLVFARRGGGWKLTALVHLSESLPRKSKGPRGAAAVADAETRSGTLSPDELGDAFTDLYATGGAKEGARLARGTGPVRGALAVHRRRDEGIGRIGLRKRFAAAIPRHPVIYALRTADGGVLAVVPVAHTAQVTATRRGVDVTPSSVEAIYNPSVRERITDEQSGQIAGYLPPRGRPRVLGAAYALVNSR
jgi:hypothetical protein